MANRKDIPASPEAAESQRETSRMERPGDREALQREIETMKAEGGRHEAEAEVEKARLEAFMHAPSEAEAFAAIGATQEPPLPKVSVWGKVRGFFGRAFGTSDESKFLKEQMKAGREGIKADAEAVKKMAMPKDEFKKMMAEGKKLDNQGRTPAQAEKARITVEEDAMMTEQKYGSDALAKDVKMAFGKEGAKDAAKRAKTKKNMAVLEAAEAKAELTKGLTGKEAKIALGQAMPESPKMTAGQKMVEKAMKRGDADIYDLEKKYGGVDKVAEKADAMDEREAERKAHHISLARKIAAFGANDLDQTLTDAGKAVDKTLTGAAWVLDKSKLGKVADMSLNAIPKTLETVLSPRESIAKAKKAIRNKLLTRGQGTVRDVTEEYAEEEAETKKETPLAAKENPYTTMQAADVRAALKKAKGELSYMEQANPEYYRGAIEDRRKVIQGANDELLARAAQGWPEIPKPKTDANPAESALNGFKKAAEAAQSKPDDSKALEKMDFEYAVKNDDIRDQMENMTPPANAEEMGTFIQKLNIKIAKQNGVSLEKMNAARAYGVERLGSAEVDGVEYLILRSKDKYGRISALTKEEAKSHGWDNAKSAKADRTPGKDAIWSEVDMDEAPDEVTRAELPEHEIDLESAEPQIGPEIAAVVKAEAAKRKPVVAKKDRVEEVAANEVHELAEDDTEILSDEEIRAEQDATNAVEAARPETPDGAILRLSDLRDRDSKAFSREAKILNDMVRGRVLVHQNYPGWTKKDAQRVVSGLAARAKRSAA